MATYSAKAAVVREAGGPFLIEDVTYELDRPEDVLVRIVAVGICHTDLIMRDQLFPFPLPGILGHEGSGVVEAVGRDVTSVAPGDHVVLSFMACGTCRTCRRDEPAYCEDFFALNVAGARADGSNGARDSGGDKLHDHFFGQSSFGTYALGHSRNVVKVRRDAPLERMGPLGCGIQTGAGAILNTLAVPPGATLAVFGSGGVGLSAVMAAKVAGAGLIVAVDPNASRLQLALELGATHTIDPLQDDPVEAIRQITGGSGVEFSLETSGGVKVVRQAIDGLAVRGVCGLVGAPPLGSEASFDVNFVMIAGRTVRGVCEGDSRPSQFIPHLIDLNLSSEFPFERLIKFYDFAQINEAVDDASSGRTIKPVLRMPSSAPAA